MYEKINEMLETEITEGNWFSYTNTRCRRLFQTLHILDLLDNQNAFLANLYKLGRIYDYDVSLDDFIDFMEDGL